ncbi:hypothetical protein [Paludisphaera mucosa]|uniref:Uncharacterized protein n=1 Tax=Paludisphaera mucosa TaxID=3030827 RepID=A0ABT6FJF0_9BACT|nr:hypothetical protein [Paludisphaera mucosa]MDG3007703.1 hypothetical protein [Paludisphaera mucosa]
MMRRRSQRRGYAMVMVVLFVTLMLGLWSLASREIGTLLRIEQARASRVQRDKDSLPGRKAMAKALSVALDALAGGYPRSTSLTRAIYVGEDQFALTFACDPDHPEEWTIQVTPTTEVGLESLDASLFSATPP